MTLLKIVEPEVGSKNSVADPRIPAALKEIEKVVNGELEGTNNFKAEGIVEGNLSKELQEKLTTKLGLSVKKPAGSETAVSENFYEMKTGTTLTLPAATLNRIVGAYAANGPVKVKTAAGIIAGDFFAGATANLTEGQHLLLLANGTNWFILAGEPKREASWEAQIARANLTAYTPSTTRETEVLVELFGGSGGSQVEIFVGGTRIGFVTAASSAHQSLGFQVGAGVAWEARQFEAIGSPAATLKSSYRSR